MMKNIVFNFIFHEHLSYLSIRPLQKWLFKQSLVLFNVSHIETKGSSLGYSITKKQSFIEN